MASLASRLLGTFFRGDTQPDRLELALWHRGQPVPNVARVRPKPDEWRARGDSILVKATWGPFTAETTFDATALLERNDVLDVVPLAGPVTLPAGMTFERELTYGLGAP